MLTPGIQFETDEIDDEIDLENPLNNKETRTSRLMPTDDWICDLNTLLQQIQACKEPLENHIYQKTRSLQAISELLYISVTLFTGVGFLMSGAFQNNTNQVIAGSALIVQSMLVGLPPSRSFFSRNVFPFHKLPCIKYPTLDTYPHIDINQIINTTRIANLYFTSIPIADAKKDGAEVLRNLNSAEKAINREMKIDYMQRGKEILSVLNRCGIFSNNTGPAQGILGYCIPFKSVVESLVPSAPKRMN